MFPRDYVARCAAAYPHKTAIIDGERRLSWLELDRRAARFGAALAGLGLTAGDAVGILSHEHLEVYEHLFGCYKLGAVRVGINWRYAERETAHVIRDADIRVILVQANCVTLLDGLRAQLESEGRLLIGYGGDHGLDLDYEALLAQATDDMTWPELAADDLVALSYTSGTTGMPKGVMLGQHAMAEAMLHTVLNIGLRHEDVWFPPTASAWVTFVLSSMNAVNGMTTVIPNGDFDTARFLDFVGRFRVTSTIVVPLMMQRLLDEYERDDYDVSSLRLLTYGSSPARPSLIRRTFETFGCELMQLYGLTESTGGWVSFLRHGEHLRGLEQDESVLLSCGAPGTHMEISVRDDRGQPLPPGQTGEIWLRSSTNMLGYLNLPDQTAQALTADGWLRTHDLGHLDDDGLLYLTDRKNYLIITGAANVFPSVVETALSEHPAVREVAVVGAPHAEWGEAVVAAVVLHEGQLATAEELVEFCRPRVARYEVPKLVDIVGELPKGLTGKTLKKEVQAWYRNPDRLPWDPGH